MTRRFAVSVLPILGILLLTASFATAAEDFLKLVPDSAWGFAVINQPTELDAKIQAISREMALPDPNLLERFKKETKITEGIDEKRAVVVLALEPENGTPSSSTIFLFPVVDYDKFLAQLNPGDTKDEVTKAGSYFVRSLGGYAALTDSQHRKSLQSLKVASEVPVALKSWGAWISARDAAMVVLSPGIKNVSAKAQNGIKVMKMMMGSAGEQGKQAMAAFTMYENLFQAAEKEISAMGIGLQLDKQNALLVTTRTELIPEGNWTKFAAQAPAVKENLLKGLPGEPFVAAGGGVVSDTMMDGLMKMSFGMMKNMHEIYGLSDEQIGKMSDLVTTKFKGIRSLSMVMSVSKSDEPLYANMVSIMQVDNAQSFMAGYEQYFQQYNEIVKDAKSPMMQPMEVEKCEIGAVPGLQVKMTLPKPQAGPMPPQYDKMMETMLGPGGKMVFYVAPAGEHAIVMGYVSKEPSVRLIASLKQNAQGLAADAEVSKTAALLPPDSPMVAYLSPQGTIEFVKRFASVMLPPGMSDSVNIPDFPQTPPVGFAVKTAPNEIQTTLAVPVDVTKAIAKYAQLIHGMSKGDVTANP